MSLYKISAIFLNQCKDTLKNFQVLILYVIYPVMGLILSKSIPETVTDPIFFITIFATMHMVFTPIVTTSSIISEEKEQNTLRMLVMANVKPFDYLMGVGSFVFLCTQIGTLFFAVLTGYEGEAMLSFLLLMMFGSICAILLGMTIGIYAKNQSSTNALTLPIAMVLSFMPMLANFNDTIKAISEFLFSQRIADLLVAPAFSNYMINDVFIIFVNVVIILGAFMFMYHKKGLE